MTKRKLPKRTKLTRKQLDRALLKLFCVEDAVIPRRAVSLKLYEYMWDLWVRTPKGRREYEATLVSGGYCTSEDD